MREEHAELAYGFNAAMHDPDRLREMFPAPASSSGDTGFVTDEWYEPVYAGQPPEAPEA